MPFDEQTKIDFFDHLEPAVKNTLQALVGETDFFGGHMYMNPEFPGDHIWAVVGPKQDLFTSIYIDAQGNIVYQEQFTLD